MNEAIRLYADPNGDLWITEDKHPTQSPTVLRFLIREQGSEWSDPGHRLWSLSTVKQENPGRWPRLHEVPDSAPAIPDGMTLADWS